MPQGIMAHGAPTADPPKLSAAQRRKAEREEDSRLVAQSANASDVSTDAPPDAQDATIAHFAQLAPRAAKPEIYRMFDGTAVLRSAIDSIRRKGIPGEHLFDVQFLVGGQWLSFNRHRDPVDADEERDRMTEEIMGVCIAGAKAVTPVDPLPEAPKVANLQPNTPLINQLYSGAEGPVYGKQAETPVLTERARDMGLTALVGQDEAARQRQLRAAEDAQREEAEKLQAAIDQDGDQTPMKAI
jgi:hypothetical protein